jgi:hypothetical protein
MIPTRPDVITSADAFPQVALLAKSFYVKPHRAASSSESLTPDSAPSLSEPLVDDGASVTEAARTLKIGRSTAYEALAQR